MSDIVIVGAKRTAIGSFLGQFTGVPTPTLGAATIRAALEQAGVPAADVSEVIIDQAVVEGRRKPQLKKPGRAASDKNAA
jgi:acetyl-CoA C-acetyltransferase